MNRQVSLNCLDSVKPFFSFRQLPKSLIVPCSRADNGGGSWQYAIALNVVANLHINVWGGVNVAPLGT